MRMYLCRVKRYMNMKNLKITQVKRILLNAFINLGNSVNQQSSFYKYW